MPAPRAASHLSSPGLWPCRGRSRGRGDIWSADRSAQRADATPAALGATCRLVCRQHPSGLFFFALPETGPISGNQPEIVGGRWL